jgi:recombinational DNA repair protein (RecF pathway)
MTMMELKCALCGARGGIDDDLLGIYDFQVDPRSGTTVCNDCYTSPERNQRAELQRQGAAKAAGQGLAIQAALARKAEQEAKQRGARR